MSLRKEMFIAIFLGLLLGGGAAVLFAQIPQNLLGSNTPGGDQSTTTVPPTPSPTPISPDSLTLDIVFPKQQALIEEDEINVSGKTKPEATVIVTSGIDEMMTIADDTGTFSAPITVSPGANELLIVSMSGEDKTERIVVVNYTTEEL
ncbi:MAG: hypothetical protein NUV98_06335 [Candidatus Roizmanbacteria bacterium]|nr:hypothetical protein [Candidatus Roizmanbacteria bacterium]